MRRKKIKRKTIARIKKIYLRFVIVFPLYFGWVLCIFLKFLSHKREKGKQNFKKQKKQLRIWKLNQKQQNNLFFEWKAILTTTINWTHKASKLFFKLMVKIDFSLMAFLLWKRLFIFKESIIFCFDGREESLELRLLADSGLIQEILLSHPPESPSTVNYFGLFFIFRLDHLWMAIVKFPFILFQTATCSHTT